MQFCEILNKDIDFNFNPNNIWEYFNFEMISKEEMQKFVYSVIKNDLTMNDISYIGNNKNVKIYPKINNPLIFVDEQVKDNYNIKSNSSKIQSKQIKDYKNKNPYFY